MNLRTNTCGAGRKAGSLVLGLGLAAFSASAQTSLPTFSLTGTDTTANGWRPIMSASGGFMTDPFTDGQTGQQVSEIIGTSATTAAYLGYGTVGGVATLGFRVRLAQFSSNESNLKQVTWFGFNFDRNASVDLWVGLDHQSQQSSDWRVVMADADPNVSNIGPSSAGMTYGTNGNSISPLPIYYTAAVAGTNYSYVAASATTVSSGVYDLDAANGTDAILSWSMPYATFVAAVNSATVMGTNYGFNSDSLFSVIVVTSNTQNTVNQDVLGISGLSAVNFEYSAPISAATPIPEPSTALALGALLAPFAARRRRRA